MDTVWQMLEFLRWSWRKMTGRCQQHRRENNPEQPASFFANYM
jgi:hypothetical protein